MRKGQLEARSVGHLDSFAPAARRPAQQPCEMEMEAQSEQAATAHELVDSSSPGVQAPCLWHPQERVMVRGELSRPSSKAGTKYQPYRICKISSLKPLHAEALNAFVLLRRQGAHRERRK